MRYRGKESKKSNGHIMEIGLYSLSEQVEVFSIKKRLANHFLSILIEQLSGKSETNNFHSCCFYTTYHRILPLISIRYIFDGRMAHAWNKKLIFSFFKQTNSRFENAF